MGYQTENQESIILAEALSNAGIALGFPDNELKQIIGLLDTWDFKSGIEPESQSGELTTLIIRCYQSLFALVGGNRADMKHWMHTYNHYTKGIPAEQICTPDGLHHVVEYLEAIGHNP